MCTVLSSALQITCPRPVAKQLIFWTEPLRLVLLQFLKIPQPIRLSVAVGIILGAKLFADVYQKYLYISIDL